MKDDEIGQHHRDCHDSEYDGAKQIGPQKKTLQAMIYRLYEATDYMSDEEMLDAFCAKHGEQWREFRNSLEPRRYELVRDGKLENSGQRRAGRSGIRRIVWRIVQPVDPVEEEVADEPPGQKELY